MSGCFPSHICVAKAADWRTCCRGAPKSWRWPGPPHHRDRCRSPPGRDGLRRLGRAEGSARRQIIRPLMANFRTAAKVWFVARVSYAATFKDCRAVAMPQCSVSSRRRKKRQGLAGPRHALAQRDIAVTLKTISRLHHEAIGYCKMPMPSFSNHRPTSSSGCRLHVGPDKPARRVPASFPDLQNAWR